LAISLNKVQLTNRLAPLTLSIASGQTVAIMGANGAGKSTLLQLIAGLLTPSSGCILLDEQSPEVAAAELCYVPNGWQSPGGLTLAEVLTLNASLMAYPARQLTGDLLRDWGLLDKLDWPVSRLSSGYQQKLLLLASLASRRKFLLLDEPSRVLDSRAKQIFWQHIEALSDTTRLLVTHDIREAMTLASRLLVLHRGHVIMDLDFDHGPYCWLKSPIADLHKDCIATIGDLAVLPESSVSSEGLQSLDFASGLGLALQQLAHQTGVTGDEND